MRLQRPPTRRSGLRPSRTGPRPTTLRASVARLASILAVVAVSQPIGSPPAIAQPRPAPADTWMTNGDVYAVARSGGRVYLAGDFTALTDGRGHSVPRARIAALDAVTGAPIDGFAPRADDVVWSLAVSPDGTRVYVGGAFHSIDGETHARLAAVDAVTGRPLPRWSADVRGGIVRDLAASKHVLYVGGGFANVAGSPARDLAALDAITGSRLPGWRADTDGSVRAVSLSPEDGRLYVGGTFSVVEGARRRNLAVLDASTGLPLAWSPAPQYPVLDIVASPQAAFVAGAGTGGTLASFGAVDAREEWHVRTNGDVQAIASLGSRLYAGGHFTVAGGATRRKIFVVDASTGALGSWSPSLNSEVGVRAIDALGTDVHVGGSFTEVNGVRRRGYAQFTDLPL